MANALDPAARALIKREQELHFFIVRFCTKCFSEFSPNFSHCSSCSLLHMDCIILLTSLLHYLMQVAAHRLGAVKFKDLAISHPALYGFILIDAMDQQTTMVPKLCRYLTSPLTIA